VPAWIISGSRIDKLYPYSTRYTAHYKRLSIPVVLIVGPSDKEISCAHAIPTW
jgi:hypothetical protein